VTLQNGRHTIAHATTNLAHRQRSLRFHEENAAGMGKTRLATGRFAVHQVQQFVAQDSIAKQVRQTRNGLFDGADSFHEVGALLQQPVQLILSLPKDLMHRCASGRTGGELAEIGGHGIAKRCGMQTHQRTSKSKFFTVLRIAGCKGSPEFFFRFPQDALALGE
jgi:hypothetical protein